MAGFISINGARQHNLKGIDVKIPRDKLVVITGISGSGKSSLAFDIIYAEGQRRYVESLSPYARQFLGEMQKPNVESIEGLPPTISIHQRTGNPTPRSTVATSTEIYDYLRLLFARVGKPYCYKCKRPISQQTPQQIVDNILSQPAETKLTILAPLVRGEKGEHKSVFQKIKMDGFIRVRVDGKITELRDITKLEKNKKHDIEVVVDRILLEKSDIKTRVTDSVEVALKTSGGLLKVLLEKNREIKEILYSVLYACPFCGVSFGEIEPRLFSFNSPYGACKTCDGLGTRFEIDEDLLIPDKNRSVRNAVLNPWFSCCWKSAGELWSVFTDFDIDGEIRFSKIDPEKRRILLYGTTPDDERKYGHSFNGIIPEMLERFENTHSENLKQRVLAYMSELSCPECGGARLCPEALSVKLGGKNIYEITKFTVGQALDFFRNLKLTMEEKTIARMVLKEIVERLQFLIDVGLSYLTLDRKSATLAGGEAQRIRLASQVGSGLVGVCYVLDEPTIGLHVRDNKRLLDTLTRLRDLGNTVIVVEHDEDTIRSADHIIDIGPGAGEYGGRVVAEGSIAEIIKNRDSITGRYLSREEIIPVPRKRRKVRDDYYLEIVGAREHNLKDINVRFPLGCLVCVTGVSGSGKSTLVDEILYRGIRRYLYGTKEKPGTHKDIKGIANLDKVIVIDQSPIGRTSRSNPGTYTGVFDEIRRLFAMTKEARTRGYLPGRFSFNLRGGRCEECQGQGTKIIEMHFLPDVYVICQECKGKRYNRDTLEIKFRGKDIAEVLEMSVGEAMAFFANFPQVVRILKTLDDVGLGYVALGQSSTTLSGGEAQRVKLATELARPQTGHTLYILDEPTTGLHFADINKLLVVLNKIVDMGNSVIIIEHNMHVIKMADYVIDLGPEGGERGGRVVAIGTPEEIVKSNGSYTGLFLKNYLNSKGR